MSNWLFQAPNAVGTPGVGDGLTYVGDRSGNLFALDSVSGAIEWRFETDAGLEVSPTLLGDTLYVATRDGQVFGLDAQTGEERISFRSPARALTSLRIAGDTLYATGLDGGLFAHDLTDGTEQFRFAPSLAIAGAPEVVGDTTYVDTVDGDGVYAIDAETGETKWRYRMEAGIWSSPVAVGGIVYVGCADGNVYALDAREGSVRWRVQTGARASGGRLSSRTSWCTSATTMAWYSRLTAPTIAFGGSSRHKIRSSPRQRSAAMVSTSVTWRERCTHCHSNRAFRPSASVPATHRAKTTILIFLIACRGIAYRFRFGWQGLSSVG